MPIIAHQRSAFVTSSDDERRIRWQRAAQSLPSGANFTSPSESLAGLSYAFDVGNARFVLLDQFRVPGECELHRTSANLDHDDLATRPTGSHAFVFSHKGLLTESHPDTLFGNDPAENPAAQDAFITSLAKNGVRYLIHGHDHMHDWSFVATTDGASAKVMQVVCASDSNKFYLPATPSNDESYDVPRLGHARQTPLSQELNTVGYYIVSVDGPRVSWSFTSSPVETKRYGRASGLTTTPALSFTKRETFGYGQNGHEFCRGPGSGLHAGPRHVRRDDAKNSRGPEPEHSQRR